MGRHKGTQVFPGGEERAGLSPTLRIKSLDKCLEQNSKSAAREEAQDRTRRFLVDQSLVKERKDESFALTDIFILDGRGPDKC
jgi:hypothetical protein